MRAVVRRALAVSGLVLGACAHGTAPPAPPAPTRAPPHGRVERLRFASEALGVTKAVVVYLPAGYDAAPTRRWPVFYYLHGLAGAETDWVEDGKLEVAPAGLGLAGIGGMPDGDNGFYADALTTPDHAACRATGAGMLIPSASRRATCVKHAAYETYVTRDLVGWVDHTFRTVPAREGRGIAGLSMGGFGALMLALRHPDLFGAAASHSGLLALLYAGPYPYAPGQVTLETEPRQWGGRIGPIGPWVRAIFGPDIAAWRAHDPAALVQQLTPGALALYLDAGSEDELLLHNHALYLHDLLRARGIDHAWHLGPGGHTFRLWAARLPHSLAFLRDHLAGPRD